MKRLIMMALLINVWLFSAAREFNNADDFINYYSSNIGSLDPIEGVYELFTWVDTAWGKSDIFPQGHYYIHKDEITGKIKVVNFVNGIRYLLLIGEKISGSNLYKLSRNNAAGDYTFKISDEGFIYSINLQAVGESKEYMVGNYSFNKIYPTAEDLRGVNNAGNTPISKQWSGTGFAIGKKYIVTNYHVVENASSIKISGINGSFYTDYEAKVIATDRSNDLALVQITDSRCPTVSNLPYGIKTQQANVGESVFVLGYPLTSTMGEEIKLTTGVVSSRSGFQGDVSLYQISAPIQPGNSGGPLFDNEGNIIGIVCAKHNDAENVGYAIKASYLQNLVESAFSVPFKLPSTNQISTLPLSAKIQKVENYIYQIKCEN